MMESERPIEKLLRAWGKRRLEQASTPIELHPADRRMLQDEVARTFGNTQPKSSGATFSLARFWPRLAFGLGLFAVLAIAVSVLFNNRPATEQTLARRELAPEATPAPALSPVASDSSAASSPDFVDKSQGNKQLATTDNTPQPALSADNLTTADSAPREPLGSAAGGSPAMRGISHSVPGANARELSTKSPAELEARRAPPSPTPLYKAKADEAKESLKPLPPTAAQPPQLGRDTIQDSDGFVVSNGAEAGKAAVADRRQTPAASASAVGGSVPPSYGVRMASKPSNQPTATTAAPSSAPASTVGSLAVYDSLREKKSQPSKDEFPKSEAAIKSFASAETRSIPTGAGGSTNLFFEQAGNRGQPVLRFYRLQAKATAKSVREEEAASAKPVLTSFEVEKLGQEIRIVDEDGSVYAGNVEPLQQATRARPSYADGLTPATRASGPSGPSAARPQSQTASSFSFDAQSGQSYSFHVIGTNRSSSQPVIFTGKLLLSTNGRPRISGEATLGRAKSVKIEAEQAKP